MNAGLIPSILVLLIWIIIEIINFFIPFTDPILYMKWLTRVVCIILAGLYYILYKGHLTCPFLNVFPECKNISSELKTILGNQQLFRIYKEENELLDAGKQLCESVEGEMIWFNVPLTRLIFKRYFDQWLLPAMKNNKCTKIIFVLNEQDQSISGYLQELRKLLEPYDEKKKIVFELANLSNIFDRYKLAQVGVDSKNKPLYTLHYFGSGSFWLAHREIEGNIYKVPVKIIAYKPETEMGDLVLNEVIAPYLPKP